MTQAKVAKPYSALSSLLGLGGPLSRPLEKASSTPQNYTTQSPSSPNIDMFPNAPKTERSCVLFSSYAIRSSDNPSDWILRVRGRAFNKTKPSRSNKIALGMARRIAGVPRSEQESASLEQRLGFFFDTNSVNLTLNVEVVGLTSPGPMVLDYSRPLADEPEELSNDEAFPFPCESTLQTNSNQTMSNMLSASVSTLNSSLLSTPSGSFSEIPTNNTDSKFSAKVAVKKGHFNSTINLPLHAVEKWRSTSFPSEKKRHSIVIQAIDEDTALPVFGQVQLIESEGISVISDIDDTIKDSGVFRGKKHVFRSTFLQECREVPGMSQVYQDWYEKGSSFHYVSNSPWELYPMLESFFQSFSFPMGSSHLKSWDLNHKALFYDPMASKRTSIQQIFEDFPKRKYILIGDSGELDLELYTSLAREHPEKIIKIFIRDVTSTKYPEFIKAKNSSILSPRLLSPHTRSIFGSSSSLSLPNSPSSSRQNSWSEFSFFDSSKSKPKTISPVEISISSEDNQESFSKVAPMPIINNRKLSVESTTSGQACSTLGENPSSSQLEPNPAYLTACAKLQKRVINATLGLPPDLVTLFSSPLTLSECPIVKKYFNSLS